ncbi:hypothetical protein HY379_02805 [Candidatus Saccharibacteria bacterium]|nr:hypothetical protein [Candidatus Saccharibacteria bacterium]
MEEPSWEIRPELKEWVESMKSSTEENTVVLRGLHMLYFDIKTIANTLEKGYLIAEGLSFAARVRIAKEVDRRIFKEEAERFYAQQKPQPDNL